MKIKDILTTLKYFAQNNKFLMNFCLFYLNVNDHLLIFCITKKNVKNHCF